MPRYPGGATVGDDGCDRESLPDATGEQADGQQPGGQTTRRNALAAVGSLSLGLTAGCLDTVQSIGQSRVSVDPVDPADDPEATPGEFHFLLEKNDITVDELYHDTDDDDLILFYGSDAETATESDDEIALIYRVFSEGLIDRGSDVNYLYTEVSDRFDGQVEGWAVNAEWAEQDLSGDASDLEVWNAIAQTKVYEDGDGDADNGTDTDPDNETDEVELGDETSDGDSDDDDDDGDGDDRDDADSDDEDTDSHDETDTNETESDTDETDTGESDTDETDTGETDTDESESNTDDDTENSNGGSDE